MQAIEQRGRTSLSVSCEIKERVRQRKQSNQTYDDVLGNLLEIADIGDSGLADGVVFLYSVPIDGEMKKLKTPIPLLLHQDKNRKFNLANHEYKILVSFCDSLDEAMKDAGEQFVENLYEFTDTTTPMTKAAQEFGEKLKKRIA